MKVKVNQFLEKELKIVFQGQQLVFEKGAEVEVSSDVYEYIRHLTFVVPANKAVEAKASGLNYRSFSTKACCGRASVEEVVMNSIIL